MNLPLEPKETPKSITAKLFSYCRVNNWAGYDPYDALNSRVFKALPFLDFRLARLALTQGVKRSPINFRPLLLVPKSPNPKGLAIFLSAATRLAKSGVADADEMIIPIAGNLLSLSSSGQRYTCWGYNFDWQQRNRLIPKGSPNIICSTFAANALLDAHELYPHPSWLGAAVSAADFVLENLFWREATSKAFFNYTLMGQDEIHNANLLGAAFLCRVSRISGEKKYLEPALDAARYSVSKQSEDGSWAYGEAPSQKWIDNFHTGFNLVSLKRISEYGRMADFDAPVRLGFDFYRTHFFMHDGAPKYYHNSVYPIDIHSVAQSIITLVECCYISQDNLAFAHTILDWAISNLWDARGFFYYQKWHYHKIVISYMRWSQAWMLLALSRLLEENINRSSVITTK